MSDDFSSPAAIKKQPVFSTAFQAILLGLLLYLVPPTIASIVLVLALQATGMSGSDIEVWFQDATLAQFLYVAITESLVIAALIFLVRFAKIKIKDIGIRKPALSHIQYVIGGFMLYYVVYIVIAVIVSRLTNINLDQEQEIGFNTDVSGGSLLLAGLSLVILPPLVEEILFRGYLYNRLRQVLSFAWSAFILSLLFGAAHLQLGSGNSPLWIAAIDTFILSLVLVYIREKTGTIWAGVAIHALKNAVAFVVLFHIL